MAILSLTEKIKQKLITWLMMIQSVSFTSAAFEAFTEAIKFLGILKNTSPKIKYTFV